MNEKIRIGISACLLGENVRYDGQHKHDHFLTDTLGPFVEYVSVCPEVECGLPVPREAMRLVGSVDNPRLMTQRTGKDLTDQMQTWAKKRLKELEQENLVGFIFKSKSPSSGMERVKIYNAKGGMAGKGVGIFARIFMEHFPLLPVEDEGRLKDPALRENFIARVFTLQRYRNAIAPRLSISGLTNFHAAHKLLLMSHSPNLTRKMGNLLAQSRKSGKTIRAVAEEYEIMLLTATKAIATAPKNVNVLQHIAGYFKTILDADEKKELNELFQDYHKGLEPLIVPLTMINHYVRKYKQTYLQDQVYLKPHPVELHLRNHA